MQENEVKFEGLILKVNINGKSDDIRYSKECFIDTSLELLMEVLRANIKKWKELYAGK